jgi:hypothetical protein
MVPETPQQRRTKQRGVYERPEALGSSILHVSRRTVTLREQEGREAHGTWRKGSYRLHCGIFRRAYRWRCIASAPPFQNAEGGQRSCVEAAVFHFSQTSLHAGPRINLQSKNPGPWQKDGTESAGWSAGVSRQRKTMAQHPDQGLTLCVLCKNAATSPCGNEVR